MAAEMKATNWSDVIEREVRKCIDKLMDAEPELKGMPERDFCETVVEGVGCYVSGVQMRLDELNEDGE